MTVVAYISVMSYAPANPPAIAPFSVQPLIAGVFGEWSRSGEVLTDT